MYRHPAKALYSPDQMDHVHSHPKARLTRIFTFIYLKGVHTTTLKEVINLFFKPNRTPANVIVVRHANDHSYLRAPLTPVQFVAHLIKQVVVVAGVNMQKVQLEREQSIWEL